MDGRQLTSLQKKLKYYFKDPTLLQKSLTHSSYANENPQLGMTSNERLEFLGDSLLGMTVALLIFRSNSGLSEGRMTKLRADLVCEKNLAELALTLDLGTYLLLGRGEENGGGRNRPSILSDAFESVLAAMFLDGGYEVIEEFISHCFKPYIDNPTEKNTDYKTLLQEMVQKKSGRAIIYNIINEQGPDHNKLFIIDASLDGNVVGSGMGKSKKSAEQEAAKAAISVLKNK